MNAISGTYEHTSTPVITRPERKRTPEQIVAELIRLVFGVSEPNDENEMPTEGRAVTLDYEQFKDLSGFTVVPMHLYYQVQWATWEEPGWWIIVGFGSDIVLVAPNSNHAPV